MPRERANKDKREQTRAGENKQEQERPTKTNQDQSRASKGKRGQPRPIKSKPGQERASEGKGKRGHEGQPTPPPVGGAKVMTPGANNSQIEPQ